MVHEFVGNRAISTDLSFNKGLQRYLNLESISASQIFRRLNQLSPEVSEKIFLNIVEQLKEKFENGSTRNKSKVLNVIDASVISKALTGMEWAKFRKDKAGIKLHLAIRYHDCGLYPSKAKVSSAKHADVKYLEELLDFEKGVINVFDRGYSCYELFDKITKAEGLFVTRLKENAATWIVEDYPVDGNLVKVSDVRLGNSYNYKTKYLYRYIELIDEEGKTLRFLTNIMDLPPEQVTEIYRLRWQIELFFKWIKQHFTVKHFFATSENAVKNQMYIALIAYCLIGLIRLEVNPEVPMNKLRVALRTGLTIMFNKFKLIARKLTPS